MFLRQTDPVSSGLLGPVQSHVCSLQYGSMSISLLREDRHSQREGNGVQDAVPVIYGYTPDCFPQLLSALLGYSGGDIRHDDGKLFTSIAAGNITTADMLANDFGNFL